MRLLSKLFLSLVLLSGIAFASDAPNLRTYPQQGIMVFKGLDEKSAPTAVRDGYATEAQNVKFSLTGGVSKRDGYSLVTNLDIAGVDFQAITGLYYTKLSSGTEYRIATIGSRFYYDNAGTWTLVNGGTITYAQNNQFIFTTALDNIIFSNDVDAPQRWTGSGNITTVDFTSLSAASQPTRAKVITYFKNFLIVGNVTENGVKRPTRFRWSNVGTIGTWSDDDYIDIDALGGQEIQGIGILGDNLYFLLTDSIYKVSFVGGDDTFIVSKSIDGTGCIAKNSIQEVALNNGQDGLIFLSKDKQIHFFDGTNITDIALYIDDTLDALTTSRLPYAVSATDHSDYYLAVSTGDTATANNLLIDFNFETLDWSKHTQIDSNAMYSVLDSDGDDQIYSGNYHSFIYKLFDSSIVNDIGGFTGTVDIVTTLNTDIGSGLQVLYDTGANVTATGAIVRLTGGTGAGLESVVADVTGSGIIVTNAFSTTPDSTTTYSIGDIDAIYTTKWFDLGEPSRNKKLGELYLWAKEEGNMSIDASYAKNFGSYSSTQSISLQGAGAVWGTGVWGTAQWGGQDAVFKILKLAGSGRYVKFRFRENDIDETFNFYGYTIQHWGGDVIGN